MKNTMLILLLGAAGLVALPAQAQDDDTARNDTASDDPADSAPADDSASDDSASDDAASDDAASDDAAADETGDADAADSDAGSTEGDTEGGTDQTEAEEEVPTDEADPEPEVATPDPSGDPEGGDAGTGLAAPDSSEEPADPATEEPAEAPAASSEPEPLPWRNTFFTWTNQVTFNSFLRDAQLSYNPTYQQNFSLSPRWYLGPMTQLRGNVTLGVEVTDTDGNALNRDPQIVDPTLTLLHMIPWEGFIFMPSVRLAFPVSKASQAAQRYIQAGAGLTIVRIIPEVANLTLAGVFRYSRWFAGSNVVRVGDPQPDRCGGPAPTGQTGADPAPDVPTAFCDQLGTASAASDIILAGISATMTPVGGFSINLSAFLFTLHGFGLAPWVSQPGQVLTSEDPIVIEDGSPSHWRNFTFVSVSVAYEFTPWLNMSLGIQNSGFAASAYNPDGSIRNPLFTPDTQVFLSATFGVDTLYNELFGETEDDLTPEERQRRQQGLASGPSVGGAF